MIVHRSLPAALVPTFVVRPLRRTSSSEILLGAAALNAVVVFALVVAVGGPHWPVGQDFFLSVALVALATGPVGGGIAGCLAVVLFEAALLAKSSFTWNHALSDPDGIRLASYLATGISVGYVAQRGRRLLNDSLGHLDALLTLAGRDLTTAALDTRGLRRALDERLASGEPFSLLVLELTPRLERAEDEVRRLAGVLAGELARDAELARLGPARFAILASAHSEAEVATTIAGCRAALREAGYDATFGWALPSPTDTDGLPLFSDALERLYSQLYGQGVGTRELAEAPS